MTSYRFCENNADGQFWFDYFFVRIMFILLHHALTRIITYMRLYTISRGMLMAEDCIKVIIPILVSNG